MRFPEEFGPDRYLAVLGSLHIEKSALHLCGTLISGTGLDNIMKSCGLSITGVDTL